MIEPFSPLGELQSSWLGPYIYMYIYILVWYRGSTNSITPLNQAIYEYFNTSPPNQHTIVKWYREIFPTSIFQSNNRKEERKKGEGAVSFLIERASLVSLGSKSSLAYPCFPSEKWKWKGGEGLVVRVNCEHADVTISRDGEAGILEAG